MRTKTKRNSVKEQTQENNSQLRESKAVEGTPFWIHKYDNHYIVTCGKYRHSTLFGSEEEALQLINQPPTWELISMLITAIIPIVSQSKSN